MTELFASVSMNRPTDTVTTDTKAEEENASLTRALSCLPFFVCEETGYVVHETKSTRAGRHHAVISTQ